MCSKRFIRSGPFFFLRFKASQNFQTLKPGSKIPKEPGAVLLIGEGVDRSVAMKLLKSIRSISDEFRSCLSPVVVPESRYVDICDVEK